MAGASQSGGSLQSGLIDRYRGRTSRPTPTAEHGYIRRSELLGRRRMNATVNSDIRIGWSGDTQSGHGLGLKEGHGSGLNEGHGFELSEGARTVLGPRSSKYWRRILNVVSVVVRFLAIADYNASSQPGNRPGPSILPRLCRFLPSDWKQVRKYLPDAWCWDIEYNCPYTIDGRQYGCWTCTPLDTAEPEDYPLKIAHAPVVLPVEYRWSPTSGVTPPPDPLPTSLIDCRLKIPLEIVKDIFVTFEGCVGFYLLINGLLQIIVPGGFDTAWASSYLPQKFGGLKVCYIEQSLQPTMLSKRRYTDGMSDPEPPLEPPSDPSGPSSGLSSKPVIVSENVQLTRPSAQSSTKSQPIQLNDFIEARSSFTHGRKRFSGRIGLKVARGGAPYLVMSTHIITETILGKPRWTTIFDRGHDATRQQLDVDWNKCTSIWAGNEKIGTIHETFDKEACIYPTGYDHDVTLIEPKSHNAVDGIVSPVPSLGWLNHDSWTSLRQQESTVKILADTRRLRAAKSIKCSRPSDVLVVGEGIFLNQKAAAGGSKSLKEHKASTWNDLVSRAILYRVYPDFDPPNGQSGTALYADGVREDGTQGPGIVGFQSFVQRSGHVQNFEMEGPALERRLQLGRVAFYGAFEVPAELKKYDIV